MAAAPGNPSGPCAVAARWSDGGREEVLPSINDFLGACLGSLERWGDRIVSAEPGKRVNWTSGDYKEMTPIEELLLS